jgi:opacity protein-like surface antigen
MEFFMKKIASLSLVALLGATGVASAEGGANTDYYVKLDGGYSTNARKLKNVDDMYPGKKNSLKSVPTIGVGIGTYMSPEFRTDLTLSYMPKRKFTSETITQNNVKYVNTQNFKSYSLIANTYYDVCKFDNLSIYMNLGAGLAKTRTSDLIVTTVNGSGVLAPKKKKTSFAWNAGMGASYKISPVLSADFGYRYSHLGKFGGSTIVNTSVKNTQKLVSHDVLASLRYSF